MWIFLTDALHYVSQVSLAVLGDPRQWLHRRHRLGLVLSIAVLAATASFSRVVAQDLPVPCHGLCAHVLLAGQRSIEADSGNTASTTTTPLSAMRLSLLDR